MLEPAITAACLEPANWAAACLSHELQIRRGCRILADAGTRPLVVTQAWPLGAWMDVCWRCAGAQQAQEATLHHALPPISPTSTTEQLPTPPPAAGLTVTVPEAEAL